MYQPIQIPSFQNVAATGLATAKVPGALIAGKGIFALRLTLGGTFTRAMIDRVSIKLGGKTIIDNLSGAQIQDINDTHGRGADATTLVIYFGDPTASGFKSKMLGSIDGNLYPRDMDIEVQITGATNPTLKGKLQVTAPKSAYAGVFTPEECAAVRGYVRGVVSPSAAMTSQSFSVAYLPGALLWALHLLHAQLTAFAVRKDGTPIFDEITNAENDSILDDFGRTQQSGFFSYFPAASGEAADALVTLKPDGTPWAIDFRFTTAAADTITTVAEVIAPSIASLP